MSVTSLLQEDLFQLGTTANPQQGFYLEEPVGDIWGGDHGGPNVVTDFERDVHSHFDENLVTYKNAQAANLSNGYTFLDRDSDGWYDHIERIDERGIWIYCGDGVWNPLL